MIIYTGIASQVFINNALTLTLISGMHVLLVNIAIVQYYILFVYYGITIKTHETTLKRENMQ